MYQQRYCGQHCKQNNHSYLYNSVYSGSFQPENFIFISLNYPY